MPDVVEPQVVDAITVNNVKTVGEFVASASNVLLSDMIGHQRAMNQVRESANAAFAKSMTEVDPIQAMSALKLMTGNDLGQTLAQLGGVVAQLQQVMKGAQTTQPETGS